MSDSRGVPILVPTTGVLQWNWRESYLVLLAFVVPGAVLRQVPVLVPALFVVLVAVGLGLRVRRVSGWWPLLRTGEVVSVDTVEFEPAGSGTVRLSHATQWAVQRGWFTGEATDSTVTYTIGDGQRTVLVHGLPYTSGTILAHPQRPKAKCVSEFPFDLRRRADGHWSVSVEPTFWAGALATAAMYAALVSGGVISAREFWFS